MISLPELLIESQLYENEAAELWKITEIEQ